MTSINPTPGTASPASSEGPRNARRCKCGDPACTLWRDDEVCPWCSAEMRRITSDPDFEGRAGDMGEGHYRDCPHGDAPTPRPASRAGVTEQTEAPKRFDCIWSYGRYDMCEARDGLYVLYRDYAALANAGRAPSPASETATTAQDAEAALRIERLRALAKWFVIRRAPPSDKEYDRWREALAWAIELIDRPIPADESARAGQLAELRAGLEHAIMVFDAHAQQQDAKGTVDGHAKAIRYLAHADRCRTALRAAPSPEAEVPTDAPDARLIEALAACGGYVKRFPKGFRGYLPGSDTTGNRYPTWREAALDALRHEGGDSSRIADEIASRSARSPESSPAVDAGTTKAMRVALQRAILRVEHDAEQFGPSDFRGKTASRDLVALDGLLASLHVPRSPAVDDETPNEAEVILGFIEDTMSGGNDLTFSWTGDHDGMRSAQKEDGFVVWINQALGDPDERGYLPGESFRDAMRDWIARDGTERAKAELRAARSPRANRAAVDDETPPNAMAELIALLESQADDYASMAKSFDEMEMEHPRHPDAARDAATARKRERLYRCGITAIREQQRVASARAAVDDETGKPEPTTPEQALELSRAIAWAAESFGDRLDKQGKPAILHSLRVMLAGTTHAERVVGVLHDVVEDCDWRPEDIYSEFGDEIGHAVERLSRQKNSRTTYQEYIESLAVWPLARAVKLQDLADNLARVHELPEPERSSLRTRYIFARERLAQPAAARRSPESAPTEAK